MDSVEYVRADLAAPDAAQWKKGVPIGIDGYFWLRVDESDSNPTIIKIEAQRIYEPGNDSDVRDSVDINQWQFLGPITPAPDAIRQARRETWEQVGVVLSGFGRNIRKVDLIEALERERLRAEGEKGEGNGRIEMA